MWLAALSLPFLLCSSLVFINAVERLGDRLGLTRFALGAVLVAFLTALPETSIAIVSPFVGTKEAFEVGEAAVLGAPSITILLGVPLIMNLSKTRSPSHHYGLKLNYRVFAVIFPFVAILGFAASQLRAIAATLLLSIGLYLSYLNIKMKDERFEAEEELYLSRILRSENLALPIQLLIGLVGMIYSADILIDSLSAFSNPFLYSVIISPFGTCLQEVIAATLLTMKGKWDVGLAVLAGENMIQTTIVSGIGMLVTPWSLPFNAVLVALTFSAIAGAYSLAPRTMRFLGVPAYLVYLIVAAV